MRKLYVLFIALSMGFFGNAQTIASYVFSQSSVAYSPISGTALTSGTTWDDAVQNVTIPFTFVFGGSNYTACNINTNGYLTFGTTAPSSTLYTPISSTTGFTGVVSAFARDLINNGVAVSYTTTGSSPNRVFVVQWDNARRYSLGAITGDVLNFQIRLYETSNVAEVSYGTWTATNTTAYTGQVGLRGTLNTDYNNRTTATDWAATTAGGSNSATVNTTNTILPASGLTLTWTPPAVSPCTAPSNQPTAYTQGTISATSIAGSFTAAASAPSGYLIVRSSGAFTGTLVDGTTYVAGGTIGNGTVVQAGSTTSFTASSLTGNTAYTFTIFSFNAGSCSGGPKYNSISPLTGSATTCPATPTSLAASNISQTGFQLNFTSSKGGGVTAVSYSLEVATDAAFASPVSGSPFSFNDTTTVQTTMSYSISGLNSATGYYYRIKANGCNTATASGNTTTSCAATSLPYSEGFESLVTANTLPSCMSASPTVASSGKTQTYIVSATGTNSALVARTGTKFAAVYWSPSNTSGWFFTAPVQLTGGVTYKASVWYKTDGVAWSEAGLYYGTSAGAAAMTNNIVSVANASATAYTEITGNFTPSVTGVYYVGIKGFNSTTSPNYIAFDDISIDLAPSTPCVAPTDQATSLVFGTQGTTSQAGSFTAAGSAPSGYLVVRSVGALSTNPVNGTSYSTGGALGNGVVVQSGSTISFTASSLTGNTSYTYTVFSFNNTACLGGPVYNLTSPLSANSTTCPITPTGITASNLTSTSFVLNWTSSKGGGVVNPITYTIDVATDNAFASPVSGSPFTVNDTTTNQTTMRYSITGLSATTQYYYRIKASGCNATYSSTGNTTTPGVPPANDDATNAITLTVGGGCTASPYTNVNATQGLIEKYASCFQSATTGSGTSIATHTVWFKFNAPSSGAVRISTDLGGGTLSDTHLALFSASDASNYSTFNIISCDDDNGVTGSTKSLLYATGLVSGQTYYVSVDGYNGGTGTFCVAVDQLDNTMLSTTNTCGSTYQTPSGSQSNYTGWVPLVDGSGKLVAMVKNAAGGSVSSYALGQNISVSQRQNAGIYYLNRNYLINNSTATNVDVQFFFLDAELASLNAADGTTLGTLGVTRQTGSACQNNFATANGSSTFLTQTGNGSIGGVSWITVNTPGFSNFYLNKAGAVLPANLLTFSGARTGGVNNLKWSVAQEVDVQAYELERSEDGRSWINVGTVSSLGNTASQRSYSYTDNNISGLKQLYRLRQVDRNGSAKLSNIVVISGVRPTVLSLSGLFPNPAVSKISLLVDAPAKDNITIVLMDAVGRVVRSQQASVDAGANTLSMDVSGLSQGSYMVKLTCQSNCQSTVSKFVKE